MPTNNWVSHRLISVTDSGYNDVKVIAINK